MSVPAVALIAISTAAAQTPTPPERLGLGKPAPREVIAQLDSDVRPDGSGLPQGRGTAAQGAEIVVHNG